MRTRSPPQPTRTARMLREYLDIIDSKQREGSRAKRYDIYRRAGNETQTDRIIKYLLQNGLAEGNGKDGYIKTKKGEDLHSTLKRNDLVGILTQDLSGKRLRSW